ncbi:RNA polymerase sigma factor [Brevibacillus sp. H7]|uniref:RNA polymerase sigma factor n=1 Tax=Brevibacillus sp. H7 TaxID=3349138 RepID=UPI00381D2163
MNDEERVETWFRLYHQDLYNYLVYFTGNRDVEDLVQEVFIKAIRKQSQYQGFASVKTWLFRIARNCAIDEARRRRVLKWIPEEWLRLVLSKEREPSEIVILREDVDFLYQAIRTLKQSYRDVVLLRHVQGLTVSETAEILDWSESKVNTTVHRALKQLKKKMEMERNGIGVGTCAQR